MKNRKRIIVAFLCAAMLVVGVGYAAVSGSLSVSGTAEYRGSDYLDNVINSAIHFESAEGMLNCSAALTNLGGSTTSDTADLTVLFQDASSTTGEKLYAYAKYVIHYHDDGSVSNLPDVIIEEEDVTLTCASMEGTVGEGGGFSMDWGWAVNTALDGSVSVSGKDTPTTLEHGGELFLYVLVTFTQPSDTAFTGNVTSNPIGITINYSSEIE